LLRKVVRALRAKCRPGGSAPGRPRTRGPPTRPPLERQCQRTAHAARGQAGVGDGHAGQPCGLPTCPRPPTPLTTGVRPSGLTRFACRCACRRFSSFLQIRKRDPSPLPNRCGGARGRVQRPQGGRQPPGVGGRHAPRRGGPL